MFLYNDPRAQLDLFHQHAAELAGRAAADRLVREASAAGRRRRFGRWPRGEQEPSAAASVTA